MEKEREEYEGWAKCTMLSNTRCTLHGWFAYVRSLPHWDHDMPAGDCKNLGLDVKDVYMNIEETFLIQLDQMPQGLTEWPIWCAANVRLLDSIEKLLEAASPYQVEYFSGGGSGEGPVATEKLSKPWGPSAVSLLRWAERNVGRKSPVVIISSAGTSHCRLLAHPRFRGIIGLNFLQRAPER